MRTDAVGAWLSAAARHPLLNPAEEIHLAQLVQAGSNPAATPGQRRSAKRARDRMIEGNLRLVASIAKGYQRRIARSAALSLEDLLQEGVLGLNRAVDKFDPEMGYKFSTYATWWIRQSLARGVDAQSGTVKIPPIGALMLRRWTYRPGDQSFEEFCRVWKYDRKGAKRTLVCCQHAQVISLDGAARGGLDGVDGAPLLDLIPSPGSDPAERLQEMDLEAAIAGLEGSADLALLQIKVLGRASTNELAELLGCSKSRMTIDIAAARARLQQQLAGAMELVA